MSRAEVPGCFCRIFGKRVAKRFKGGYKIFVYFYKQGFLENVLR
jgi:hypothetical protein